MNIQTPYVSVIVGKAGSGKTTLVKYLIYCQQNKPVYERFEIILVFTKTSFNQAYHWIPNEWVHCKYNPRAIKKLMRIQSSIRDQGLEPLPVCLIFDDCLSSKQYQSDFFTDLIANRRHFNISMLFCTQYLARQVPTIMRENTDLAFIFKQFSANSLNGCYNAWGSLCTNNQYEFERIMKQITKYQFLCLDTRTDNETQTKIIGYCPKEIPAPPIEYLNEIPLQALRKAENRQ